MEKFFWGYVLGICFMLILNMIVPLNTSIEVEKRIQPEIQLIIKDNKVDTLYIYKQ